MYQTRKMLIEENKLLREQLARAEARLADEADLADGLAGDCSYLVDRAYNQQVQAAFHQHAFAMPFLVVMAFGAVFGTFVAWQGEVPGGILVATVLLTAAILVMLVYSGVRAYRDMARVPEMYFTPSGQVVAVTQEQIDETNAHLYALQD